MKPAVLPVPVWAVAIRSRPASTAGMAWLWMGSACRSPVPATARGSSAEEPS